MLLLFAFALDPDRRVLDRATPGLFWVAVLFSALLAVQRAFAVEAADGNRDALRLSGLDPAGIFLGKGSAIAAQLLVLEAVLLAGVVALYGTDLDGPRRCCVATCVAATVGLAAAGTPLRRPRRRPAGARDAAAAAAAAGRRPGADRRHPGLRGRPGHGWRRRLGVGQPLGVFAAVYVAARRSPAPAPAGGVVTRRTDARAHTGSRATRVLGARRPRRRSAPRCCSASCSARADARSRPTPSASSTSTCPSAILAYVSFTRHRRRLDHVAARSGRSGGTASAGAVGRGRRAVHRR